jgi:methyl-accepting chemotaxis protein
MKWTVGTKITIAFSVVLLGLVGIGITCFVSTRHLVETTTLRAHAHEMVESLEELFSLLKDAETGQRGFLLTGEESYLEPYTAAVQILNGKLAELKDRTRENPEQAARLEALEPQINNRLAELQRIIALRRAQGEDGFKHAVAAVASGQGEQMMDAIRRQIGEMQDAEKRVLEQRSQEADAAALAAKVAVLCGVPVCCVLVFVAGILLARNISRPLRLLTTAADSIASGDLTVKVSADDRTDEVGALATTFGRMTASLQEMAKVAEQIAAGDLRVSVHPQSERDQLATAFVLMVENLRQVMSDIAEGANVLGTSATEIVASTAQLASSSAQTAAAVTETTTTVEEVRQTAQVSSQKARVVAGTSHESLEISSGGKASTEETSKGMLRIREQMSSIAQSMVRLSEQTQAIGQIIATVDDLAQQSNLLAVNASIEAAKAGEQGRGFAVVAQEVRSLAEQSKGATNQVRTILSDIQKATNAAVMATEQGTKAVESGVKQSIKTGESIATLGTKIEEAASASAQIAASSQQQLIGMDQVGQAMESIKKASTQNVDSARQLEVAARNLSTLGQRLKERVGLYKM